VELVFFLFLEMQRKKKERMVCVCGVWQVKFEMRPDSVSRSVVRDRECVRNGLERAPVGRKKKYLREDKPQL
jgi:hypothetical protein